MPTSEGSFQLSRKTIFSCNAATALHITYKSTTLLAHPFLIHQAMLIKRCVAKKA